MGPARLLPRVSHRLDHHRHLGLNTLFRRLKFRLRNLVKAIIFNLLLNAPWRKCAREYCVSPFDLKSLTMYRITSFLCELVTPDASVVFVFVVIYRVMDAFVCFG